MGQTGGKGGTGASPSGAAAQPNAPGASAASSSGSPPAEGAAAPPAAGAASGARGDAASSGTPQATGAAAAGSGDAAGTSGGAAAASSTEPPPAPPPPANLYSDRIRTLTERTQAAVESYLILPFRAPLIRSFSGALMDDRKGRTRTESDVSALALSADRASNLEEKRQKLSEIATRRVFATNVKGEAARAQTKQVSLIVMRGKESDALFQLASLSPEEVLSKPRVHYVGEEGRDAGGLVLEWAESCAAQLADPTKSVNVLRVENAPEGSGLNGDYIIVGLCCSKPSFRKMGRNNCTIFYSTDAGVWYLGENAGSDYSVRTWFQSAAVDASHPDAAPSGIWELPPSAAPGYCGLEPAPTVKLINPSRILVEGAGEEIMNGEFIFKGRANNKPIFRKMNAEEATIYWTENYKEWRMFVKGYKGNRSLYQSFEQTTEVPLTSWIVTCGHPGGAGFKGPLPTVSYAEVGPLFEEAPDGTLAPKAKMPQPKPDAVIWRLYLGVGRLLGLAIVRSLPLPLSLNRVTLKLLLGKEIAPFDVEQVDPTFHEYRLRAVMRAGGVQAIEELLCEELTFVSAPVGDSTDVMELKPGGAKLRVTEANKREYLRLLCEHYLIGRVRTEFGLILEGFHDIVPEGAFQGSCAELARLLCGMPSFDIDEWQEHTESNRKDCNQVKWFFEILRESRQDIRGRCLHFITGASRVPLGGFQSLRPPFRVHIYEPDDSTLLPVAHTCSNTLDLPTYESKEMLKERLFLSLEFSEGFGFH